MDSGKVIIGARKRPVEEICAAEAEECKMMRARTAAAIKKNRQLQQVDSHISRAMHILGQLETSDQVSALARIAETLKDCLPNHYAAQLAMALIDRSDAERHSLTAEFVQSDVEFGQHVPGLCQAVCAEQGEEEHVEERTPCFAEDAEETPALDMSDHQLEVHEDLSEFQMEDRPNDGDDQKQNVESQTRVFGAEQVCEDQGIVISSEDENDESNIQDRGHAQNVHETHLQQVFTEKKPCRRTPPTPSVPLDCPPHRHRLAAPPHLSRQWMRSGTLPVPRRPLPSIGHVAAHDVK